MWSENQLYLALMPHMHRVGTLSIRIFRCDDCLGIDTLLSLPAPELELLSLETGGDKDVYVLPNNLFAGYAPKLDLLCLCDITLPKDIAADTEVTFHQPRGPPRYEHPVALVHPARPVFSILPPPHKVSDLRLIHEHLIAVADSGDVHTIGKAKAGVGVDAPRIYLYRVLREAGPICLESLFLDEAYVEFVYGVSLPRLDTLEIHINRTHGEDSGDIVTMYLPAFLIARPPSSPALTTLTLTCPVAMAGNPLLPGILEKASEITRVLAVLAQETSCILRDLAVQWSAQNNILKRLPDEVLALCFTFLPFRARIAASHVSRHWRTTALATPAIWADLDISGFKKYWRELIRMALPRTGCCAVDLRGSILFEPDSEGIVHQCLLEHLHHIRGIHSTLPKDSFPLTSPAPLLETLDGFVYHLDIPRDFLGGAPQRLRSLCASYVSLPEICPALSTVVRLTLEGPLTLAQAVRFGQLFNLFPALEYLYLHELEQEFSHLLPAGPPPRSLQKLELITSDEQYDLTPHYVDWRTDTLLDVSLEQETADLPHIEDLLKGATSLDIQVHYGLGRTRIAAAGPGRERIRSVTFVDDDEDASCVPDIILRVQEAELSRVHSVQIPISALNKFLRVFAGLPKLRELDIFFKTFPEPWNPVRPRLPWAALADLSRVKELCPLLEEIDIEAVCWNSDGPLTSDDAREMLVRLLTLGERVLSCTICIKGFPEEIMRGVDVSQVDEYDIYFEES
ncbi:hypothetical protein AURDEDRAFT_160003 [Auricularia subglabra TFB-10046 SS5]|nr:hypothetical protein AURDEDRAFT_160003 [Auricularia subglabra TFB-10046 SS5]